MPGPDSSPVTSVGAEVSPMPTPRPPSLAVVGAKVSLILLPLAVGELELDDEMPPRSPASEEEVEVPEDGMADGVDVDVEEPRSGVGVGELSSAVEK